MKTKKILLAGTLLIVAMIAVYAFGLKSKPSIKQESGIQQQYDFMTGDTTRFPEAFTEKRTTQIEIINGKKKIKETIIKMKGDSIIEKKVIEREEDADDNFDMNLDSANGFSGGFYFKQFGPDDIDSLMPLNKDLLGFDLFENDSILQQFGFRFNPGQHFNFESPFNGWDDDFMKNFDFDFSIPNSDMSQIRKRMEELQEKMMRGFEDNQIYDNPFKNQKLPNVPRRSNPYHRNKAKSMNDIITDQLLNDGYIKYIDEKYKFEINEKFLKINGKKQDKAIYDKYKKIIEDNTGVELEDEFDFKFTNKKKLNKKTIRI